MDVMQFAVLRGSISKAEQEVRTLKSRLAAAEAACLHNRDATAWSAPVRATEAFKEEVVDFAATEYHGSDVFHHTKFVDATRSVFSRTCRFCGKTETTNKTKAVAHEVPAF